MRRKSAAPPIHPYVRDLLQVLPAAGSGVRCCVLASSAAAAGALQAAVCAHRPGLLGVRFVTPAGLLAELAWWLGEPLPDEALPPLAERALLRGVLEATANDVARYALRHRATLHALWASCREWLRAGAPRAVISPRATATLAVADAFARALIAHRTGNRTKNLATLRALAARGVLPRSKFLLVTVGAPPAREVANLLAQVAAATPQFTRHDVPAASGLAAQHGRSAHPNLDAELRAAAHRCGLWFASTASLADMVVAAPRLGPYVPFLWAAFRAEGIPLRAHAETALANEPRGALAVHAARLLFDGAPARSYLALLGSDLWRVPLAAAEHRALEVQARTRGLSGCTELPERLRAELAPAAPAAAAGVAALAAHARAAMQCVKSADKAAALAGLLASELAPPAPGTRDERAAARLHELLLELEHAEADAFLLDALDLLQDRGLPLHDDDAGGVVHVVEYADALAFPATHLTLLGAADEQLPQPAPLPIFFAAGDREALDLLSRSGARAEEAERLARLCALPTQALHVSRAQTDVQGRMVGPSPLLDAAFAALGVTAGEASERAHPLPRAAARTASGVAALDAAVTHLALQHGSPAAASQLLGARGAQVLKRVQRLERFAGDLACDGDVGAAATGAQERALAVSDLELLAKCAHQFFYRKELRVEPLPPEPDALALAPGAVGSAVHALLAELHQDLVAAAASSDALPEAQALAADLAPRLDALLRETSPLAYTLPALHHILVRQWSLAVARSFADDVRALRTYGIVPLHQEHRLAGQLSLGDGRVLAVRGRADRIDRLADGGLRVIDYKTGGNAGAVLSTTDILKGRRLQMPVYAAMASQTLAAPVRDLGVRAVRPDLEDGGEFWLRWRYAHDFLGGKLSDALGETLRVLVDLRARGTFVPSMDADRVCRFCEFRAACRRLHPPSRERVFQAGTPEVARYLALRGKSIYAPMLEARHAP
jgi:RecB family exonuclease